MVKKIFIGREYQLGQLEDLTFKKVASLVVIKGRRRIGKSKLVQEFAKNKNFYHFSGIPPTEDLTSLEQKKEFASQLSKQSSLPNIATNNWSDLFDLLWQEVKDKPAVILFDEITWLGHKDPTFLPKLKNAWDIQFKNNGKLILILCGSISTWIEKNILSSTGYLGRVSLNITLKELSIRESSLMLSKIGFKRSNYEKFLILSVTGGVPWYIELISPQYGALDNIRKLCFEPDSVLSLEHDHIFLDLFGRRSEIYGKIANSLSNGKKEYKEISKITGYASGGILSEYINDMIISGYITAYNSWSFKSKKYSSIVLYGLSDNYLQFYYSNILPRINNIKDGEFLDVNIAALPWFYSVMGLQFENMVLNNRNLIYSILNLKKEEIIASNPYLQRKTKNQEGCQIDLLIQTNLNTLFICEIKFSRNRIDSAVIVEVQKKIGALKYPKNITCIPVLIHINGVTDAVIDSEYFYRIIDFSEFLK